MSWFICAQSKLQQFYFLMKEERDNEVTYCFDLQQVQNIPKLPIQKSFYSLQLAFYCFCVVDRHSKNPNLYIWSEDLSNHESNEIGSVLLHFLRNSMLDIGPENKTFQTTAAKNNFQTLCSCKFLTSESRPVIYYRFSQFRQGASSIRIGFTFCPLKNIITALYCLLSK